MKYIICFLLMGALSALGYEKPTPRYIEVDLTWRDAGTRAEKTAAGQLWFTDLPLKDGKGLSFGKLGYFSGIKWFVPKKPGDIWLARSAGCTNSQTFLLHDHYGERVIEVSFDRIEVLRTADSKMDNLMDQGAKALVGATRGKVEKAVVKEVDLGDLETEEKMAVSSVDARATTADGKSVAPLRLATEKDIGVKEIPIGDLVKIVFGTASENLPRETYTGRYVEYSRSATGDAGRVQVASATFFGGPGDRESFIFGDFRRDDSIVMAGGFLDLDFVDPSLVKVLGSDPARDAYPLVEVLKAKRLVVESSRITPVLVHYSAGLKAITEVVRLPWGVGIPASCVMAADEAIYVTGTVGPHFDTFIKETRLAAIIPATSEEIVSVADNQGRRRQPNPGSGTAKKGQKRELGPESFIIKMSSDLRSVAWAIRVQGGGVNMFKQPEGGLLVRRGMELFHVSPEGAVTAGAKLEMSGGSMAVCPKTGALYFGGSYRSGTGLEPYVNPYLYKMDASGKMVWTAYGWSGPIVGVDQFRLEADSSLNKISVAEDGGLSVTGWSDGGNTVLAYQPYDMRKPVKTGGFCSSTWGAKGGMTIRIAALLNMDPDTMEVSAYTPYVGYIPTSDIPSLVNIYNSYRLPSGELAIVGGGALGFVETHDAWTRSWWRNFQTDEFAIAKGGPFFTLMSPDFNRARMATITPGASGLNIAGKGSWLLLYSAATDKDPSEVGLKWRPAYRTLIRNAVQPKNGGGLDAYVILVNTQGEPVKEGN